MTQITICNRAVSVIEHDGQRVVTLAMIDDVHQRPAGTARKRFNDNRRHFVEGEDYFVRNSDEAREMGFTAPNGLTTLTESGYLMLVKSFTDDLAWTVQRQLVNSYFRPVHAVAINDQRLDRLETAINRLIITHQTGTSVVTDKSAKEWLIEYGCVSRGRGAMVLKVGNALRRIAKKTGTPLLTCARTGTDLFPYDLAVPFMESQGKAWVRLHNEAIETGQSALALRDVPKSAANVIALSGASTELGRIAARGDRARMTDAEIASAVFQIGQAYPELAMKNGVENARSALINGARAIVQLWNDLRSSGRLETA